MAGIFSKLFGGNKSEKDVKVITPVISKINQQVENFQSLSNDELRGKTVEFKARIQDYLKDIDRQITETNSKAEDLSFTDLVQKDRIYQDVDKLKKDRLQKIEEVLKEILPEAFAVVKETARRFKENPQIVSTATDLDRELSVQKQHVTIEGDQAIYQNTWTAGGTPVTWNMVHYDVQLIGGAVLHSGKIAEMATGEGKTLVSTLPAYLNALAKAYTLLRLTIIWPGAIANGTDLFLNGLAYA